MPWIDTFIRNHITDTRVQFYDQPIEIHDTVRSTGAGMYNRELVSDTAYARSGAVSFGGIADRGAWRTGGYHEQGRAVATMKSSDTGDGGPTNRALLMRTGSSNGLYLVALNKEWQVSSVTECPDTDELVCDLESLGGS